MCTAITYQTKDHYFGRNLDLDYVYQETVTITPRRYPLRFRQMGTLDRHYAMIGMAYVLGDYPLYYDATNEAGLSMAGLNFPATPCTGRRSQVGTTSLPLNSSPGSWAGAPPLPRPGFCWTASTSGAFPFVRSFPWRLCTG